MKILKRQNIQWKGLILAALLTVLSAAYFGMWALLDTWEATKPTRYYLLNEQPIPQLIEVDPSAPPANREARRFELTLPDLGNDGPEGVAFVPNNDVRRYGLFGLDRSLNGGYFLVSTQAGATIYVFDVPLAGDGGARIAPLWRVNVSNLERDAAALFYDRGALWVVGAKDNKLYKLKTKERGGQAIVQTVYNLDTLPFSLEDIEGLTFQQSGVAILADDAAGVVARYDDFPTCLTRRNCEAVWINDVSPEEPSGAAWDPYRKKLLIVSDEGSLFSLSPNGDYLETIFSGDYDLEGVTVVRE